MTGVGVTTTREPARRGGGRMAWLAAGSLFSVALLASGSLQMVGLLGHQRHRTHTVITVPVRRLDVSSGGGSVTVVGTTGADVTVDADISEGLFASSHSVTVDSGRLELRSTCPPLFNVFCRVDYTVHLPDDVPVTVSSSGGGIHVDNVAGDLDLVSSGGGIRVTGGAGRLQLHSSGGGVTATALASSEVQAGSSGGGVHLSFVQPPTNVDVSSSGGSVTVDLPATPDFYRVDASASGGSVHNDVRTDPSSARVIHAESSGGGVHVDYQPQP